MIVSLDGTVLTIAQPTMLRDLHASLTQVQWTSTGYLIGAASLLVFTGRLADRCGHRRVFAVGMLGFAATSAGIGMAPGLGWVVGLRIAQGVCGALLQPATLGMLRSAYPPDRLAGPIALRTSAIGLAAAAGPVVGGALVAHLGWRAVFFLNVVPALVTGVLALTVGSAATTAADVPLDLPGACLLAVALVCLVHTLVGIPGRGWTVANVLGLLGFAITSGALVGHERRTACPLVPAGVLRSIPIAAALGMLVSATASVFGTIFIAGYLLQDVLGLDPLRSGLIALPLPDAIVAGAPASAIVLRRFGARLTSAAGMVFVTVGILGLSMVDTATTPVVVGGCCLVLGLGFGAVMVAAAAVIVGSPSQEAAGVVGGLQQTAMNIGPVLGVAAATMLMTSAEPGILADTAHTDGLSGTDAAFIVAMRPTLTVLATVAAAGALLARMFPGRSVSEGTRAPHTYRPDLPTGGTTMDEENAMAGFTA